MQTGLKEIKKQIDRDWLNAFPELTEFKPGRLYKVLGCLITGIELIKIPGSEKYRPHFVMYPLWKSNLKENLDSPSLLREICNKKGMQFSVPYDVQAGSLYEAVECLKAQAIISMEGDVILDDLFTSIDKAFDDILVKTNAAQQAKLYELKFFAALYACDGRRAMEIADQVIKASAGWNMGMFEMWYGNFDVWLLNLKFRAGERPDFLRQVEDNKKDKLTAKLKYSGIIL